MKKIRKVAALVGVLALFGCEDITDLEVINQNDPDRARAITSPEDVEALIAGSYYRFFNGWEKSVPGMALSTTADEGSMSWGNWASRELSSEPRLPWTNKTTASYQGFTYTPWRDSYRAASLVYDGLLAINDSVNPVAIGDGGVDTPRALTFAKFVQGVAHGHQALMFDKGFIIDETVNFEDSLPFFSYQEIMDTALKYLDMAIDMCTNNSFVLPPTWIQGSQFTNIELRGLARWYKGRYLHAVARNSTDRDAADWGMINTLYDQGLADLGRDFIIYGSGSWWQRVKAHGQEPDWMRADYKTLCSYEVGGTGCANWLQTAVADRYEFQFQSPDARIMGATPTSDGTDYNWGGPSDFYASRGTYHFSEYFYYRYYWFWPGYLGDMPMITVDEINLRKAEAVYRLNGVNQTVVDLINSTRVGRGQMTPLTTNDAAADVWYALMHEKRVEMHHLASSMAYFDKRGYPLAQTGPNIHAGLVVGSPCHFPIPSRELELMELPSYTFGGVGSECTQIGGSAAAFANARIPFSKIYAFDGLETIGEKLALLRDEDVELDPGVRQLTRY